MSNQDPEAARLKHDRRNVGDGLQMNLVPEKCVKLSHPAQFGSNIIVYFLMSSSKAKAKGVSATSFFDLKAELSKKETEFLKARAEGRSLAVVGGVKRPDKKPTVWERPNKGLKERANRDLYLEEIVKPTPDSARAILERKAKIYEKLRKGKAGGLTDAQYDSLLVDFDSNDQPSKYYQVHSSDEDESLTVPKAPAAYEDDPIVEYEDEFGRLRTARRSDIPRNLIPDQPEEVDSDEDIIIRDPVNHFPVYEPSEERVAEVGRKFADENNPLNIHYDASKEVRTKGAGYYQFSADEETRRKQMEELKVTREETERTRQELGAEDIKPGEEGMTADGVKSRAMEKRKRELEERRKLLEAKRKKPRVAVPSDEKAAPSAPSSAKEIPGDRPAAVGNSGQKSSAAVAHDPFALLEARATDSGRKKKNKDNPTPTPNEADAFLSNLEQEFLASRMKR